MVKRSVECRTVLHWQGAGRGRGTRVPVPSLYNVSICAACKERFNLVKRGMGVSGTGGCVSGEREFFIDDLLVRIHVIIEMIWWTGLAPCEFELPFSGSLICTFLACVWHTRFGAVAGPLSTQSGTHWAVTARF